MSLVKCNCRYSHTSGALEFGDEGGGEEEDEGVAAPDEGEAHGGGVAGVGADLLAGDDEGDGEHGGDEADGEGAEEVAAAEEHAECAADHDEDEATDGEAGAAVDLGLELGEQLGAADGELGERNRI